MKTEQGRLSLDSESISSFFFYLQAWNLQREVYPGQAYRLCSFKEFLIQKSLNKETCMQSANMFPNKLLLRSKWHGQLTWRTLRNPFPHIGLRTLDSTTLMLLMERPEVYESSMSKWGRISVCQPWIEHQCKRLCCGLNRTLQWNFLQQLSLNRCHCTVYLLDLSSGEYQQALCCRQPKVKTRLSCDLKQDSDLAIVHRTLTMLVQCQTMFLTGFADRTMQ